MFRNTLTAAGQVPLHFPATAKYVIHLFMNGGPSQMDLLDPKPELIKYAGRPVSTPHTKDGLDLGRTYGAVQCLRARGVVRCQISSA